MPRYVLLLGSNQDAQAALARATDKVERNYGVLRLGEVLPSPDREAADDGAIDMRAPYLNCALEIASPLTAPELKVAMREIEAECGRVRPAPVSGLCAMDIDIALVFENGAWQVNDAKAVAPDYAQQALSLWLQPEEFHARSTARRLT